MTGLATTTLFWPLSAGELVLIETLEYRAFPPRLPDQPEFHPVSSEAHAVEIARGWNTRVGDKLGFVTRFAVRTEFLSKYEHRIAGPPSYSEYRIPAQELDAFNSAIVGKIEITRLFTEEDRRAHEQSAHRMLEIEDLHVSVQGKEILRGLSLVANAGELHAIMGPNGSGKSTLSYALAGREGYELTEGRIVFKGEDMTRLAPEARAAKGLFLAFQYPVEIPGVTTMNFLKAALNAQRRARQESELDAISVLRLVREKAAALKIPEEMLKRALNVGFSGGEKKRLEILQMALFEPRLAVLDETDSGLDIDALKLVAEGVNAMRAGDRAMLVITHYQRLLNYIVPDRVHVLIDGRIVAAGGKELAHELEAKGYAGVEKDAA